MVTELRARRDALEELWRQGLSGHALLAKHTTLMDATLEEYFRTSGADPESMCLVALGGYGRKELFPYSDIDLMLLYRSEAEKQLGEITEAIFYPLWDAGLEVGHGVRTPAACLEEAGKDFFLLVSLLDARLLIGSEELFSSLMKDFQKKFVAGQRKTFLQDMLFHRQKRHEKFGNHSYLLEPHIKESRGGFRDVQAMLWSAQVLFNLKKTEDLERAGLISSEELHLFEEACDTLIRTRNRLHYISGRKNDQLFFEHQEEMAEAFGYRNEKGMLGVERFMRDIHARLQTIALTSDLFFEHAREVLGLVETGKQPQDKELEKGITLRQGRIHLTDMALAAKRPYLLMRVFANVAQTGNPVHHRTKKLISGNLHLIHEKTRYSKRMNKAFIETIQGPHCLTALTDMLESGLLSAYIPEFIHLKSLAQHDVYHIYTVDRHLLQTVEEVNLLRTQEHALYITLPSPYILFLAALLHDVGKGYGKNHSEYGAQLAEDIGKRIGMPAADINCLTFLIREHLFLAEIAQRRDLEDEGLIIRCAKQLNDLDRLTMLYLLTIADAKATGPSAWSDWKAALLLELYLKVANTLGRDDLTLPDPREEISWMRSQIAALLGDNPIFPLKILPDDYLLGNSPDDVANHIRLHETLKKQEVILIPSHEEGHWSILIMAKDRPGILSKICGVLALHNLKVLAAQIFTWLDGTIVDVLHVASTLDNLFDDQNWHSLEDDLGKAIHFRLGLTHRLHKKMTAMGTLTTQMSQRPSAKVVIDTNASDNFTIIEVYAANRAGLLYDITRTLSDFGINTFRAKIGTKADQIVDVFYVLDHEGHKIEDPEFQNEIKNGLLHAAA